MEYNRKLKPYARENRKNATKQENHLWYDFLSKYPIRFQRQKPIDNYIVDFYCHRAKLAIEIDGNQHYTESGMTHDRIRTHRLELQDINVIRFTNDEVDNNFNMVCACIDDAVRFLMR